MSDKALSLRSFHRALIFGLAIGLAVASSSCISGRHSMSVSLGGDVEKSSTVETPGPAVATANASGDYHLVCWNVHKADDARFVDELNALLNEIPEQDEILLCLQETRSTTFGLIGGGLPVSGHYAESWRYPWAERSTGVMTLSESGLAPMAAKGLHSERREFFIASPKVCLRSELALTDGRKLIVVNCHGLNFVTNRSFQRQLDQVFASIGDSEASEPVIVCGDFNVWSSDRLEMLEAKAREAGLAEAGADQHCGPDTSALLRLATPIFGFDPDIPLDRIYARGIEIQECRSLTHVECSDHSPLVLRFSVAD